MNEIFVSNFRHIFVYVVLARDFKIFPCGVY